MSRRMHRSHRVAGALVGAAVGDALAAPFASGPPGAFSARFPTPARGAETEMRGGEARTPGQFTGETGRALAVARSLVAHGGLHDGDLRDLGRADERAGTGHGPLMVTAALWFSRFGREATADAARQIAALLPGGPTGGEDCAIFSELVRTALDGDDPLAAVPDTIDLVAAERRDLWATVLAPGWNPATATEGDVPAVGRAVWALRHGRDFAGTMRRAIDLGGETSTVAAAAGALAGAVHGMPGIPMRWTSVVHGRVPGTGDRPWRLADLQETAAVLDGRTPVPHSDGVIPRLGPTEVLPGIWAANLHGARGSDEDFAVVSLCRVGEPFPHRVHRLAYLADNDHNTEIDVVLADVLDDIAALRAEGRRVLVHCHGGASRTGLVLRAWMRRTEGLPAAEATARIAERWPHLDLWNASFTAALERVDPG